MSVYDISGQELTSSYGKDGASLLNVYDVTGARIGLDTPEPDFFDTAIISVLPTATAPGTKQGACTDGTYIYMISGDFTNGTYYDLLKFDISGGTVMSKHFDGSQVNFGHGNDMTYNPNNGHIYVCTMLEDGSVIELDASDLSYVATHYVSDENGNPYKVYQIAFNRTTNRFLSAYWTGSNILIYDADWSYLSLVAAVAWPTGVTRQGCETDGIFFYRVGYNPNKIDVIRLSDGTRVKTITNPMSGEPETMLYDWSGNYYISRNATSNIVYVVQMFEEA